MNNETHKYLTPATLNDLQTEMLILLQIVDKVCRKSNIEYWLDAGTLLGAVRHKGFIPWDDDIDIGVPADDYNRLISALDIESKTNKNIFLYSKHNDVPKFAPERLATTKMVMRRGSKMVACFIDIFPARIINKVDKKNDQNISNIAEYFIFGSTISGAKINNRYIKNTLKGALIEKQKFTQYFHSDYLPNCNHRAPESVVATIATTSSDAVCGTDAYFPYTDIFPLRKITFEGMESFAPNNFENYLSTVYGDYMTLPPKSKQVAKHANELYFCSSNQFALEVTTETLTKGVQSFYRHPIRRFFKNLTESAGIYEKMKNWDKARRGRKYGKVK